MDEAAYVHLEVALERGVGDTIRGIVGARDGRRMPFNGWLELMSAFDTARAGPAGGRDLGAGGGAPVESGR